jgi:hypothetical protein
MPSELARTEPFKAKQISFRHCLLDIKCKSNPNKIFQTPVDSKPLSAQEPIAEEEEEELEIEEKKQSTEVPAVAPKELTESEKLILSEKQQNQ